MFDGCRCLMLESARKTCTYCLARVLPCLKDRPLLSTFPYLPPPEFIVIAAVVTSSWATVPVIPGRLPALWRSSVRECDRCLVARRMLLLHGTPCNCSGDLLARRTSHIRGKEASGTL